MARRRRKLRQTLRSRGERVYAFETSHGINRGFRTWAAAARALGAQERAALQYDQMWAQWQTAAACRLVGALRYLLVGRMRRSFSVWQCAAGRAGRVELFTRGRRRREAWHRARVVCRGWQSVGRRRKVATCMLSLLSTRWHGTGGATAKAWGRWSCFIERTRREELIQLFHNQVEALTEQHKHATAEARTHVEELKQDLTDVHAHAKLEHDRLSKEVEEALDEVTHMSRARQAAEASLDASVHRTKDLEKGIDRYREDLSTLEQEQQHLTFRMSARMTELEDLQETHGRLEVDQRETTQSLRKTRAELHMCRLDVSRVTTERNEAAERGHAVAAKREAVEVDKKAVERELGKERSATQVLAVKLNDSAQHIRRLLANNSGLKGRVGKMQLLLTAGSDGNQQTRSSSRNLSQSESWSAAAMARGGSEDGGGGGGRGVDRRLTMGPEEGGGGADVEGRQSHGGEGDAIKTAVIKRWQNKATGESSDPAIPVMPGRRSGLRSRTGRGGGGGGGDGGGDADVRDSRNGLEGADGAGGAEGGSRQYVDEEAPSMSSMDPPYGPTGPYGHADYSSSIDVSMSQSRSTSRRSRRTGDRRRTGGGGGARQTQTQQQQHQHHSQQHQVQLHPDDVGRLRISRGGYDEKLGECHGTYRTGGVARLNTTATTSTSASADASAYATPGQASLRVHVHGRSGNRGRMNQWGTIDDTTSSASHAARDDEERRGKAGRDVPMLPGPDVPAAMAGDTVTVAGVTMRYRRSGSVEVDFGAAEEGGVGGEGGDTDRHWRP